MDHHVGRLAQAVAGHGRVAQVADDRGHPLAGKGVTVDYGHGMPGVEQPTNNAPADEASSASHEYAGWIPIRHERSYAANLLAVTTLLTTNARNRAGLHPHRVHDHTVHD